MFFYVAGLKVKIRENSLETPAILVKTIRRINP